MSPKLHLYMYTGASSLAPHILLRETGLPFTHTLISPSEIKPGNLYPDYLRKMNPQGKVPVLLSDEEAITENIAIITHIAQLAPSQHILGRTPLETVRVYEWCSYLASTVHGQGFGMLFRPERCVDDVGLKEHVAAKGKESVISCFNLIDEKLEGREWAAGEGFTAADAYLVVFWNWGVSALKWDMEVEYPNFGKLVKRVLEREAVREALKVEGIEL